LTYIQFKQTSSFPGNVKLQKTRKIWGSHSSDYEDYHLPGCDDIRCIYLNIRWELSLYWSLEKWADAILLCAR